MPRMSEGQLNFDFDAENPVYSVSELLESVKINLEDIYFDITVEGELTSFTKHRSGHIYLSLSDDNSKIDGVMFRHKNIYLNFKPEQGMKVRCRGKVTVYEPQGRMQLLIEQMEEAGIGDAAKRFEEIKRKLLKEGLFEPEHKKTLPELPNRIGVVTSPTGAAIRDFLKIIKDRFANMEILIYPALVQGEQAAAQIIKGIEYLDKNENMDIILITRGGGSPEDLMAFNDEGLARAIFACKTPIMSAVGHQIDVSIADFVADLSVPTPSAAAERMVEKHSVLEQQLKSMSRRIAVTTFNRINLLKAQLLGIKNRSVLKDPYSLIQQKAQKLDITSEKLISIIKEMQTRSRERLNLNKSSLKNLNPQNVIERGYSITYGPDGKTIIMSTSQAAEGEILKTKLKDGTLISRLEKKETD